MIILDDFIQSYSQLKQYCSMADFGSVENPVDKVSYPEICKAIPEDIEKEIIAKVSEFMGREPESATIFIRRSPIDIPAPHIAHTDNSMGKFSLMLYLFEREDSGTAFIRHKTTGISYAPESSEFLSIVQADQNKPEKWALVDMINAKENRAVIFDSGKFHCAMPIGGFGDGIEARTVLTVFFS